MHLTILGFPTGEVSLMGTHIRWMSKQQSGKKTSKVPEVKEELGFMKNKKGLMWPDKHICREMNAASIEIKDVKD